MYRWSRPGVLNTCPTRWDTWQLEVSEGGGSHLIEAETDIKRPESPDNREHYLEPSPIVISLCTPHFLSSSNQPWCSVIVLLQDAATPLSIHGMKRPPSEDPGLESLLRSVPLSPEQNKTDIFKVILIGRQHRELCPWRRG